MFNIRGFYEKKISFVIITYNSENYINDCLNSILEIKNYAFEIFLIDNGSTDNTLKIIESFKNTIIDLTKLEKNYGTTLTRNIGLKKIKMTDYICILDSDTIINENAIRIMCDFIDSNHSVGLVGPAMCDKNGVRQIPYRKFPTLKLKLFKGIPIKYFNKIGEKMESYNFISNITSLCCDYLISACWVMPYSTYKNVGSFDENIFYSPEDVEYCIRVWKSGLKIVHLSNAQIIHIYQRISKKKLISKVNFSHFVCLIKVLFKYRKFLKKHRIKSGGLV